MNGSFFVLIARIFFVLQSLLENIISRGLLTQKDFLEVTQKIDTTAALAFATQRSWALASLPDNVQLATTTAATVDYLVTITHC